MVAGGFALRDRRAGFPEPSVLPPERTGFGQRVPDAKTECFGQAVFVAYQAERQIRPATLCGTNLHRRRARSQRMGTDSEARQRSGRGCRIIANLSASFGLPLKSKLHCKIK